jgi:hypothetical protein
MLAICGQVEGKWDARGTKRIICVIKWRKSRPYSLLRAHTFADKCARLTFKKIFDIILKKTIFFRAIIFFSRQNLPRFLSKTLGCD